MLMLAGWFVLNAKWFDVCRLIPALEDVEVINKDEIEQLELLELKIVLNFVLLPEDTPL